METSAPPPLAINLNANLYNQILYTLFALLSPPIDDTQDGLRARNHTAIAKVAALLPVNANEADLAAQCIAARSQAEDVLRLIRQNADDIGLVMRLNAQYSSMVRTSLSVHARLMRVQALRQKRDAIEGSANEDAWALHIAERSMLRVVDPNAGLRQAASPRPARAVLPEAARAVLPEAARAVLPEAARSVLHGAAAAADSDPLDGENISPYGINSHGVAFETSLRGQLLGRVFGRPDASRPHEDLREEMAESRLAGWEFPTNGCESPEGQTNSNLRW